MPTNYFIRLRSVSLALATTCALACAGAPDTHDAATDASDASECPPHTHASNAGCEATLRFVEGPDLPLARDHHGVALVETAAGPRLVVVAGAVLGGPANQEATDNVSIASIDSYGTIGTWVDGPSLPAARMGMAIGVIDTTIIAVAGLNGSFQRASYTARMQPDGTLGAWHLGPSIPDGRFHISGATAGRWMFVTGGLKMNASTAEARTEAYAARLADDGITLGAWQPVTSLPEPISHHASFVHDGYLFVAGGLGGDPFHNADEPRTTVYRARIDDTNGTLGAWESVNSLPGWVSTHAAAINGDRVYLFGGVVDGITNSNQILRARLLGDGALGDWETWSTGLPTPRAHLHYVPMREGRAYFVSGSMAPHTPVATTWVGRFE